MPRHTRVATPHSGLRAQNLIAIAVAALAAVVYVNALANGLVWDDPIVLNRQLLAFRSLHDIIFTPRNIPQYSPDYYRPLTTLSYLLDRAIAGNAPFMFHLSVVLYHAVVTYLVFRLALALFGAEVPPPYQGGGRKEVAPAGRGQHLPRPLLGKEGFGGAAALPVAAFAAALFAVHPIHSESVAWGAGRSDVLACCVSLLAVLAYRRADWTAWRRTLVAAGLVFVAALAKETAASFFVLVPMMDIVLGRLMAPTPVPSGSRAERRRHEPAQTTVQSALLLYLPFAVMLAVYLVLRQAALGTVVGESRASGLMVLPALVGAIGVYLGKLVLPVLQCAFISDLPAGPLALVAIMVLVVGIAAAGWLAWRRGQRLVTFLLLWIGLTLAPSLTIVAKIPAAPVAERYLYLPSVGFCLLAGYGAVMLLERTPSRVGWTIVITVMTLLLGAAAVATVQRNAVWRSNLSLWEDTAAKNTTDGLPARSLGAAYLEQGDHAKALQYFQLALQRRNDALGQFVIYNNLGSLAMAEQRLDEAEKNYRTALTLNPSAPDTLFNLGLIALTRATDKQASDEAAKHDQALRARQLFEQALQQHPLDTDTVIALGQALSALGDARGARAQYERALQLGLPESTAASVRQLITTLPPETNADRRS